MAVSSATAKSPILNHANIFGFTVYIIRKRGVLWSVLCVHTYVVYLCHVVVYELLGVHM